MTALTKPILIAGAGPVGLMTALACKFYRLPFVLMEEDDSFSSDTKAGTILTRTIEAFQRYGVAGSVLGAALRVDLIGEFERETNLPRNFVDLAAISEETRFPFVLNMPQNHLEPLLAQGMADMPEGAIHLRHRVTGFRDTGEGVQVSVETPDGPKTFEGSYLVACDGGRSQIREALGIVVEGKTLDVRYMLVDIRVDLDAENPRDYPYLAYFSDPHEWMILVRQPHCWRFLFPLEAGVEEQSPAQLEAKVRHFIGDVKQLEVINTITYRVHHRVATRWRNGRVFLAGDAAHLITPMWALGMNTGVLDSISLPWRLAWVARGWADPSLLDGYEREQKPLAVHGSGEMAEAGRARMGGDRTVVDDGSAWAFAMTRSLLGVRLDLEGSGDWSIVAHEKLPLRVGDRVPDRRLLNGEGGETWVHDLCNDSFAALCFTDVRRRPKLPELELPGIRNWVISRWDAPLDSGLRPQALLDLAGGFQRNAGIPDDCIVLLRPDDHVAAILPIDETALRDAYLAATGRRA